MRLVTILGHMEPISDFSIDNDDPRWIQLKPSRIQLVLTWFGAVVAIGVLVLIPLPPFLFTWLRWLLVSAVVLQVAREVRRPLRLNTKTITAFYFVELDVDIEKSPRNKSEGNKDGDKTDVGKARLGICLRLQGAANMVQGEVLAGAFVMAWFATVPYRLPNDGWFRKIWPRTLPLWRDSLDAEAFRETRVRLRWT